MPPASAPANPQSYEFLFVVHRFDRIFFVMCFAQLAWMSGSPVCNNATNSLTALTDYTTKIKIQIFYDRRNLRMSLGSLSENSYFGMISAYTNFRSRAVHNVRVGVFFMFFVQLTYRPNFPKLTLPTAVPPRSALESISVR